MRNIKIIFFIIMSLSLQAQDGYKMKGNTKEVDANFLFGYYNQDGNNGAVTGGIGTEQLQDFANVFTVNVPLDSVQSLNLMLGADIYTSASTDNIDGDVSSASRMDIRGYGNIGYQRKFLDRGETYGIGIGYSIEYDYLSFSGNVSYAKEWNEGNSEISLRALAFFDRWSLIFPSELRGTDIRSTISSPNRRSYNLQATYSQVLNRRMQMSVSAEAIWMKGLLSTPFHRVYFSDQISPDIERLPDSRLKLPVGIRFNYFPTDDFIIRSYYRYYWDDFGIQGHTMSLETPIKLGNVTLAPFYRFHTQTASKYFAPFATHSVAETFYTSDHDLSGLHSHKVGLGFTYSPLYGLFRFKVPFTKKHMVLMDKLRFRTAYYKRSTGLRGYLFSIDMSFKMKQGSRKKMTTPAF